MSRFTKKEIYWIVRGMWLGYLLRRCARSFFRYVNRQHRQPAEQEYVANPVARSDRDPSARRSPSTNYRAFDVGDLGKPAEGLAAGKEGHPSKEVLKTPLSRSGASKPLPTRPRL